ncbi:MAG: hypothetical protein WD875_12670 [Pirellulales bacterium]
MRLRCRSELEMRPVMAAGRWRWNVRDPVALRYYQLDEAEYIVLRALDGRRGLEEIKSQVERAFAPRRLSLSHLQAFLAMLHREGLALADMPGQGAHLLRRQSEERRRRIWAACANPLAIRLPGFDPTAILDWLYPKCRWLFAWQWLALGVVFAMLVVVLLLTRGEVLMTRLPALRELASVGGILMIAVVVASTKILHELGHALTCRRFGGRCHEMGVMLLVFSPCLYSNVSQAWMIPEKWRRIAISVAGIVVELMLAAVCGFLWCVSEPGYFNTFCLYVAVICSLGTVLLNGNPLLRFDGYYILSDWLEVPNLAQQSSAAVHRVLRRCFLGIDDADQRLKETTHRGTLLAFGLLSTAYRVALTAGILWFVYVALEPRGLAFVAQLLAVLVIASMVFRPAAETWKFLRDPVRSRNVHWRRPIVVCTLLAAAIVVAGSTPLPRRVDATVTVEPKDTRHVYVPVSGVLQTALSVGKYVSRGDELAVLRNSDLELELVRVEERYEQQRLLVDLLARRQIADAAASGELPTAREVLQDLKELRDQRRAEHRRLTIVAPQSGTVFDPPPFADVARKSPASVPRGSPLDGANTGVTLDVGAPLCVVGDGERWEAIAGIDEASIALVRSGQSARVQLDAWPGVVIHGTVVDVAEVTIEDDTPEQFAAERASATDRGKSSRLKGTRYLARLKLESTHFALLFGATGTAKIDVEPASLGARLYETYRQTFSLGR